MIELVAIFLIMFTVGALIYRSKYYNKEKPKVGIKRENHFDYFKDYCKLKLYWTSIAFMILSVACLIGIIIMEIIFD